MRSRFGRVVRRILVVLLLLPLLAYAALPIALRLTVPEMLAARGLPASVGWGYLDLWDLEIVLSDLRIASAGGPGITFAEFRAELVRDALAQGDIELANLRLRGASFDIEALSETALAGGGDGVPFEEVHLNDLRLSGLSEKLGRDVTVRQARLARHEDEEGKEAGLRFEVDVDAGGAPVEICGTLRRDGEAQILEGRLDTQGLPARVFDPAPAGATSTWSGSVHSAADFELRFETPAARARLRATGSLYTMGVHAHLGSLAVAEADSVWEGTLTLSGPTLGSPERAYFQGTLDLARAKAGKAGGSANALVSGLHWEGIGGWHGVPVAAGESSIESIEFSGDVAGTGAIRIDLDRVRLEATLDDAGHYRLERLRVGEVRAVPAAHPTEIRIQSLEAREVRAEEDGVRAERVVATTLEAATGRDAEAHTWAVEHPVLEQVAITSAAQARVSAATLESLRIRGPDFAVAALGARLEQIRAGPQPRIDLGLASIDTLERLCDDGRELRVRRFLTESLAVDGDGTVEAATLGAERVSGTSAGGEDWTAQGLETERFRFLAGAAEAGEAALGSLVYRGEEGSAFEGAGLRARALALHAGRGEAERLGAESLRYRTPHGASWEARSPSFDETQWRESGARSAARAVLPELRYRAPEGERWRFDALQLDIAALDATGEARIESAASERAALEFSSGDVLEALGVRSGPAERSPGAAIRSSALEVEILGFRALSGLNWRALPVTFESFALLDDGQVEAHRLRSDAWSLDDGQDEYWQADGIDARQFRWHLLEPRLKADPLEVERLEFAATSGESWAADTLLADAFDWPPGRVPRARNASADALEGSTAPGLQWRLEELEASGGGAHEAETSRFDFSSTGAGYLESRSEESRLAWSGLRATGLHIAGIEGFGAERLIFGDVSLRRGPRSGASLDAARIEIAGLERENERLVAGSVAVGGSTAALGVNEAGEWMLPGWPGAAGTQAPIAVEIGELVNRGHNRVTFVDRSAETPFETEMEPYRLRVTGLDTLTPQRAALFEVEGTLDASARLEIRGELRAGGAGFDARARARLRSFDLARLSDYARAQLGVTVRRGRGDFDLDLDLAGGTLEAAGDLAFRDLALHPEASAGAAGAAFADEFPRLDGSDGAIALRVSVQGPISDPAFDFAAAAGRAIVRSAELDSGAEAAAPPSSSEP